MRSIGAVALTSLLAVSLLGGSAMAQEDSPVSEGLKIKGFYLGMPQSEVRQLYESMEANEVAEYMSIETAQYRDLISAANEFGSMGNKIEVQYAENGEATYFKFQYNTVVALFDYGELEPNEFVERFREQYGIPEMAYENMGFVSAWSLTDADAGYNLSIDDYKNITLQTP